MHPNTTHKKCHLLQYKERERGVDGSKDTQEAGV